MAEKFGPKITESRDVPRLSNQELRSLVQECIVVGQTEIFQSLKLSKVYWKKYDAEYDRVADYVQTLKELKSVIGVEGIKFLNKNFGIIHFDRYGAERMKRQYEFFQRNRDKKQKEPIYVSSYPYSDHDDVFLRRISYDELERYNSESGNEVIYMESGASKQYFRNILFIRRYLGKMRGLSMSSHGSPDYLTLNRKPFYVDDKTTPEATAVFSDISAQSIDAIRRVDSKQFFTKDAFVIIDACNSGFRIGIAEHLARKIRRPVFATPHLVAYYKIGPVKKYEFMDYLGHVAFERKLPKINFYNTHDTIVSGNLFVYE